MVGRRAAADADDRRPAIVAAAGQPLGRPLDLPRGSCRPRRRRGRSAPRRAAGRRAPRPAPRSRASSASPPSTSSATPVVRPEGGGQHLGDGLGRERPDPHLVAARAQLDRNDRGAHALSLAVLRRDRPEPEPCDDLARGLGRTSGRRSRPAGARGRRTAARFASSAVAAASGSALPSSSGRPERRPVRRTASAAETSSATTRPAPSMSARFSSRQAAPPPVATTVRRPAAAARTASVSRRRNPSSPSRAKISATVRPGRPHDEVVEVRERPARAGRPEGRPPSSSPTP